MKNDTIQKQLLEMERELRALKSPQGAIKNIFAYEANIQLPAEKVLITYEDGDNDIITRVYAMGNMWTGHFLSRVQDNKQYIVANEFGGGMYIEAYRIESTRPILSVENVS